MPFADGLGIVTRRATAAAGGEPYTAADGGEFAPGAGAALPPETFARIAGAFFSIPAVDAERR